MGYSGPTKVYNRAWKVGTHSGGQRISTELENVTHTSAVFVGIVTGGEKIQGGDHIRLSMEGWDVEHSFLEGPQRCSHGIFFRLDDTLSNAEIQQRKHDHAGDGAYPEDGVQNGDFGCRKGHDAHNGAHNTCGEFCYSNRIHLQPPKSLGGGRNIIEKRKKKLKWSPEEQGTRSALGRGPSHRGVGRGHR